MSSDAPPQAAAALLAEAQSPDLMPARALSMAAQSPLPVVEALARNAALPLPALFLLAQRQEVTPRRLAALHPSAPPALLEQLAQDPSVAVQEAIASRQGLPEQALRTLAHRSAGPTVDLALAQHPQTPPDILHLLVERTARARPFVAEHGQLSSTTLDFLLSQPNPEVHGRLAIRPDLSASAQLLLADHPAFQVRQALARNPATRADILQKLIADPHAEVRFSVVERVDVPPLALLQAVTNGDPALAARARQHPMFPPAAEEQLRRTEALRAYQAEEEVVHDERLRERERAALAAEQAALEREAVQGLAEHRQALEQAHQVRLQQRREQHDLFLQRERQELRAQAELHLMQARNQLQAELEGQFADEYAQLLRGAEEVFERERATHLQQVRDAEDQQRTALAEHLRSEAQKHFERRLALQQGAARARAEVELNQLRGQLQQEREGALEQLGQQLERDTQRQLEEAKAVETAQLAHAHALLLEDHRQQRDAQLQALREKHSEFRRVALAATRAHAQQRREVELSALREQLQWTLEQDLKAYEVELAAGLQTALNDVGFQQREELAISRANLEAQMDQELEQRRTELGQRGEDTLQQEATRRAPAETQPASGPSAGTWTHLLGRPPRVVLPEPGEDIAEAFAVLWRARQLTQEDLDGVISRLGGGRAAKRAFSQYADELLHSGYPLLLRDLSRNPPVWRIDADVVAVL